MTTEAIEGELVDERPLAVRADSSVAVWTPTFAVAVDEMVARVDAKHDFFNRVMRKGDHYGVIPGTSTKPTLLKPGAELLLASMGLNAEFSDESEPILDVTGKDHGGEPFVAYRRVCRIYRQIGPTETARMVVAKASGECNSWEKKYRYRTSERVCPTCGKPAIIKGKEEYGGGWVCFKRKDGCGAKFNDNDLAIIGQAQGKVPNPEIFDQVNTLLKMADKRALVAATLIATGCSDIFTQDVEDNLPPEEPPAPPEEPPQRPGRTTRGKADAPVEATSPPGTDAQPNKIPIAVRAKFNTLIGGASITSEEVKGIIEVVQEHYNFPATGYVEDLHEGDESREAYRRIRNKIAEGNA